MMNIHYLQHVSYEGLGYIETWLNENRYQLTGTHFFEEGYTLPAIDSIDAIIIMGGPMSVYDEHTYPWLFEEKVFINNCIKASKKVLGICLGAQLMAVCLGAKVYPAKNKEIGWFSVMANPSARNIQWMYKFFENDQTVFHWHGDTFGIPIDGNFELLTSIGNKHQAFYHSKDVIGLQFHLEVTETSLMQMLDNGTNELKEAAFVQSQEEILQGFKNIKSCNTLMKHLLINWLNS
ncbi:type 1 glutamine amidotransferase [Aequorivita sp. Q41]|uniref:type 1 glutamine amidotransferase n=1 Tax=Aequorivita sp. Q41 TaxID=3153300 RepID=UPI0032423C2A